MFRIRKRALTRSLKRISLVVFLLFTHGSNISANNLVTSQTKSEPSGGEEEVYTTSQHIRIRRFMAFSHLSQMDEPTVLVIGDSIIEGWLNDSFRRCQALNVGLGGGGISDVKDLLQEIRTNIELERFDPSLVRGIIIVIGVNDTRLNSSRSDDYIQLWQKSYEEVIDLAVETSPNVLASTILPLDEEMPLGAAYFDVNLIDQLNKSIKTTTQQKSVDFVDTNTALSQHIDKLTLTIDGVHLTPEGYELLHQTIFQNIDYCSTASEFFLHAKKLFGIRN